MRSSLLTSLREMQRAVLEADLLYDVDVEFRYVAIPDDAPKKKTGE